MKRQRASLGELCSLVKGTSSISKTSPGPYTLVTTGESHKTADSFQLEDEAACIPLISSTGHGHASLKRVHYYSGKFALANLVAAALVKDRSVLSTKFLTRYLMFSKDRLIVPLMTGAANMSISLDRLATVPVEYPPLAEQERIVKLLDKVDELRKLRTQADTRTADLIPALFNEMFGDPVVNSKGCKVVRLEEVTTRITDGVHLKPNYTETGVPFISVKNITTGQLKFDECKFISAEDHAKFTKRTKPEYLDILYTKVGATYGRPALVDTKTEFSIYVSVCLIKPIKDVIDPHFLEITMGTPAIKNQADRSIKGIGVPDLHLDQIQKFLLPLPPHALQKEFAKRVTEIREMEAAQSASRRRTEELFQSMLHKAFNGEL
jgi:type I restriction enzyme S subunit